MTSYSALELATTKALSEKCIIFYQEYEDHLGNTLYDNFVFYDFVDKDDFIENFYDFCYWKSDERPHINFELQEYISKSEIYGKLDIWKNIYVKSFCDNVDLSMLEEELVNYFDTK